MKTPKKKKTYEEYNKTQIKAYHMYIVSQKTRKL